MPAAASRRLPCRSRSSQPRPLACAMIAAGMKASTSGNAVSRRTAKPSSRHRRPDAGRHGAFARQIAQGRRTSTAVAAPVPVPRSAPTWPLGASGWMAIGGRQKAQHAFQQIERAVEAGIITQVLDPAAGVGNRGPVAGEHIADLRQAEAEGDMGQYMATWRAKAAAGWPRVRDHRSRPPTFKARAMAWPRSCRGRTVRTRRWETAAQPLVAGLDLTHLRDFMRRKDNLRFILVNYFALFQYILYLPKDPRFQQIVLNR